MRKFVAGQGSAIINVMLEILIDIIACIIGSGIGVFSVTKIEKKHTHRVHKH